MYGFGYEHNELPSEKSHALSHQRERLLLADNGDITVTSGLQFHISYAERSNINVGLQHDTLHRIGALRQMPVPV
jgi:hypothetical protein